MANQTFDLTPETTFKGNTRITVKKGFTKNKNAFSKTEFLQREPCRKKKQKKQQHAHKQFSLNQSKVVCLGWSLNLAMFVLNWPIYGCPAWPSWFNLLVSRLSF